MTVIGGVAGVVGLRAPVLFSPVLGLQIAYKLLSLIGVVIHWAIMGQIPRYALPVIGIIVFFIVGNLIAIPFPYLLSISPPNQ